MIVVTFVDILLLMKIIAEIVALESYKDIPNKNIRNIAGFPMITNCLYTFVNSMNVSEMHVISNSEDVRKIVATFKNTYDGKGKKLFVHDLEFKLNDYDIKIHIKSSLLNIKSSSIDKMVNYVIDNDIKLLKTFDEEFYVENKNGHNDDCYCDFVESEKLDFDKYKDLYSCHNTRSLKVGYYVNGNNQRGLGHIFRALDIADDFYSKPDIYYDINQTNRDVFGLTYHKVLPTNDLYDLYSKCKEKQYDIFITDILSTNIEYMECLRSIMPKAKLVNFEDDGPGAIKADLVFNALLPNKKYDNMYCGNQYYVCDESYIIVKQKPILDKVTKMFVCFGGADPKNYTDLMLQIISKDEYKNFEFIVVLGKSKKNIDELLKYNEHSNIDVQYNAKEIALLMKEADVAITSRGNMTFELALLGVPTISIAQNENEMKHEFACEKNGFTFLGMDPDYQVIENTIKKYLYMSKEEREKIRKIFNNLDLRGGRKRVMDLINGISNK